MKFLKQLLSRGVYHVARIKGHRWEWYWQQGKVQVCENLNVQQQLIEWGELDKPSSFQNVSVRLSITSVWLAYLINLEGGIIPLVLEDWRLWVLVDDDDVRYILGDGEHVVWQRSVELPASLINDVITAVQYVYTAFTISEGELFLGILANENQDGWSSLYEAYPQTRWVGIATDTIAAQDRPGQHVPMLTHVVAVASSVLKTSQDEITSMSCPFILWAPLWATTVGWGVQWSWLKLYKMLLYKITGGIVSLIGAVLLYGCLQGERDKKIEDVGGMDQDSTSTHHVHVQAILWAGPEDWAVWINDRKMTSGDETFGLPVLRVEPAYIVLEASNQEQIQISVGETKIIPIERP